MPETLDYVKYVTDSHKEADEARKPLEHQWRDAWEVFHNRFDFSKKAGWQTQVPISKFAQAVETEAAILKRSLLEARNFYTVEGDGDVGKERAPLLKRLMDLFLQKANFVVTFTDGLKLGAIVDLIPFRVRWATQDVEDVVVSKPEESPMYGVGDVEASPEVQTQQEACLQVDLLDPFKVWIDPTGRNRYVIEETIVDLDELERLAEESPDS